MPADKKKDDKKAKDAKPAKDDKKAGKDAKPAAAVAAVTAAVSKVTVSSALPVGWTEHVDPATKKTFYHNASTYIWWMLDVHMQVYILLMT
jgi:WW domain